MKTLFEFLKNPFYRVAGYTSLVWGVVGIVVSTAIAFLGDIHFHGLLHYGGAPNGAWWCFVVEHLVVADDGRHLPLSFLGSKRRINFAVALRR